MEKVAYRVREFTKAFGVGRSKVYELINSGDLRVVKTGRVTLITAASAMDWLRRGEKANAKPGGGL